MTSADDAEIPHSALRIPHSEVLSQSEVERLVAQVQAEESSALLLKPGGVKTRIGHEAIQPFDFRQPAFLTTSELRRLRLRHEEFLRSLAAHLSIYLRLEVSLQMLKLQTLSYEQYTGGLANPVHVTLFKVEPLKGVCLLDMAPRLGLTIVDRLLGGPAQAVNAGGELSELDVALLDQVAQLILNEWCQLWQKAPTENAECGVRSAELTAPAPAPSVIPQSAIRNPHWEARPVLLGHETNGRFLNSSPPDTLMLVLSLEASLGDCVEQVQLALPFLTIEPLVRQPESPNAECGMRNAEWANPNSALRTPHSGRPQWNPNLDDVCLRVSTEAQGFELSARALSALKCGDLLMLDPKCFDQVEVRLELMPRFRGRLGTSGNHWAVELTEVAER